MFQGGEDEFEKRIFERTGKNISILWYAYNAGPGAMEAMFANSLDMGYVGKKAKAYLSLPFGGFPTGCQKGWSQESANAEKSI